MGQSLEDVLPHLKANLKAAVEHFGIPFVIDAVGLKEVIDAVGLKEVIDAVGLKEVIDAVGLDRILALYPKNELRRLLAKYLK